MDAQHGKIKSSTMLLKKRLAVAAIAPPLQQADKTSRGRGKQRETKQIKVSYSPQLVPTLNEVLKKWNREPAVFCASINGESRKWGTPNVYVKLCNVCSVALYIGFGPSDPAPSMYRTLVLKFNVGKSSADDGEKEQDCFISYCPIIKRGIADHIQESDIVAAVELVMEFFWRVSYFFQDRHPPNSASTDLINLYKDSRRLGGKAFTQQQHVIIEGKHDLHAKKVSDQFKGIVPVVDARKNSGNEESTPPTSLPGFVPLAPTPQWVGGLSDWKPPAQSLTGGLSGLGGSSLGLSGLGFSGDFLKKMHEDAEKHASSIFSSHSFL